MFSSEVDTGSREENASKQTHKASRLIQSKRGSGFANLKEKRKTPLFSITPVVSGFSRAASLPVCARPTYCLNASLQNLQSEPTVTRTQEQDALVIVSSQFREVNGVPIATDGRYHIPAAASNL
ncbi:hypothetical protein [Nitrobacter winogradskyi]|uniref:Uncharacterized protein n=1 Tax=Nitrobacter winogradskyi TaxID=913 RepID=A0ACC6AHU6_NITWI|nr:hypothetical protein [Nitrobacter winogradskyi]MCP1998555.1 hypothetical protein [Nitrobacter winogradskyi]